MPTAVIKTVYTYAELRDSIANDTIIDIAVDMMRFDATPIVIHNIR